MLLPSLARRLAVLLAALSLVTLTVDAAVAAPTDPAKLPPTINTYSSWDGTSYIYEYGCPDTTTYGETVTVPQGMRKLSKFNFYMSDLGTAGSMVMRAEVYEWSGTSATGSALWESARRTVHYSDDAFHKETFRPSGVAVKPGQTYVIFASIDKDYEDCTNPYVLGWASAPDETYPGGTFVYLNSGGDESQWTSVGWEASYGQDLAFKAWLR